MTDAEDDILVDFHVTPKPVPVLPPVVGWRPSPSRPAATAMVSMGIGLAIVAACQAYFIASVEYIHTGRMTISHAANQVMLGMMLLPAVLLWCLAPPARRNHSWALIAGGSIALLCAIGCGAIALQQFRITILNEFVSVFIYIQIGAFALLALAMLLTMRKCVVAVAWINQQAVAMELQAQAAYQQQVQQYYASQQMPVGTQVPGDRQGGV